MSILNEGILMKLAASIHHVRVIAGKISKVRGQGHDQTSQPIMTEAYISMV